MLFNCSWIHSINIQDLIMRPLRTANYTKEYSKVFNNKAKLILIKTLDGIEYEYIFCRAWERRLEKADVLEKPGGLEAVLPPEYFRMMWTLGFGQSRE